MTGYSRVAITLHWLIAAMMIGNLAGGLLLDTFLDSPDPDMVAIGRTAIGLHKSFGLTVLVLTLVRIGWRVANPPPPLPGHMTPAERALSKLSHYGFYALMLLMPLSGWAFVSTAKTLRPLPWFGLFEVPKLPLPTEIYGLAREGHEVMGWVAIGMVVLHMAAALKHHVLDRDDVLARMLPLVKRRA